MTGEGRTAGGVKRRWEASKRFASRRLVPGFVVTLLYLWRHRCLVHPRAAVQFTRRIRFGSRTTIHPYSRITVSSGSVSIGSDSNLQVFSTISAGGAQVRIGDHVRVGPNCTLLGENYGYSDRETPMHLQPRVPKGLTIGDDVWIGANSVVLPGVSIGRGAVVGAGAVVTRDVASFAVVAGNPGAADRAALVSCN